MSALTNFVRKRKWLLAGGAAGAGAAGYGIYRWREHDPEYSLYLGGKRGSRLIPSSSIERWRSKEVDPHLPGYSFSHVQGVWKGQHEPTRVLTYLGPRKHQGVVSRIGESYRKRFGQESVMMTSRPVTTRFLS